MNVVSIKGTVLAVAIALLAPQYTSAQTDVTSQVEDLGDAYAIPGANQSVHNILHIMHYNGRLYYGGVTAGANPQSIVYWDLADEQRRIEQTKLVNGSNLTATVELVTGLQNANYDLLIAAEDGAPNNQTRMYINDRHGWRWRKNPGDALHGGNMQLRFDDKFFATFGSDNSTGDSPGVAVSTDDLDTWTIVGDVGGEFTTNSGRKGSNLMIANGHLFGTGFYLGTPNINGWMTHYTGDANHSFENVYSRSADFHPATAPVAGFPDAYKPLNELVDLQGTGGILRAVRAAVSYRYVTTAGRNGNYPKPVAEAQVNDAYPVDVLAQNGVMYMLEWDGDTDITSVRYSTDLVNWTTLFTTTTSTYPNAFALVGNDFYYTIGRNLHRVKGSAYGGVPSGANLSPVGADDAYSTDVDTPLSLAAGSLGVLPNDSDGNDDFLTASLMSGPANGTLTLEANGRFDYVPNAGFEGTDTFVYEATDGLASTQATVTIQVGTPSPQVLVTDISITGPTTITTDAGTAQLSATSCPLMPPTHQSPGLSRALLWTLPYLILAWSPLRALPGPPPSPLTQAPRSLLPTSCPLMPPTHPSPGLSRALP